MLTNDTADTVLLLGNVLKLSYQRCCVVIAQSSKAIVLEALMDFLRHLLAHRQHSLLRPRSWRRVSWCPAGGPWEVPHQKLGPLDGDSLPSPCLSPAPSSHPAQWVGSVSSLWCRGYQLFSIRGYHVLLLRKRYKLQNWLWIKVWYLLSIL